MKNTLKKCIFEIAKYLIISLTIFGIIKGIYYISAADAFYCNKYSAENSAVGAESFTHLRFTKYPGYEFTIPKDDVSDSEIWIFEAYNNRIFSALHLPARYKRTPYAHASTKDPISYLYCDLHVAGTEYTEMKDSVIIFYSNNNCRAESYSYTIKNIANKEKEITGDLSPYHGFAFIIPLTYNNEQWQEELLNIVFYDTSGNIVYREDFTK